MSLFSPLQDRLGGGVILLPDEFDPARHRIDLFVDKPATGEILALAYPRTTADVSAVLAFCNDHDVKVTVQGGQTGLAGGSLPVGASLVLSLERMRAIEELDADAATLTVQAGVPLEVVQNVADTAGLFFPLDLGGRGSAQAGGNAATNAGGNRVYRYGMMRALILGAEWVLADGTVVTALNKMIKNNAGYDLKHVLIGAEGTLGVITRLVLRLHPKPKSVSTALLAAADYPAVLDFLARAKGGLGATLSAFEMMWPKFYALGTIALGRVPPIGPGHGVYLLVETMGDDEAADLARLEAVIGEAMEAGVVQDAVIARSGREAKALWDIRDCPGEFRKTFWPQITFDVALPTGQIGDFMEACDLRLRAKWPAVETVYFGHVADSNLHISIKTDGDPAFEHAIDTEVYQVVGEWSGSISAEHGVGVHKREFLHHSRTPQEIAMMRTLKAALDPKGILNPGKVI
ncbi:MAG TPA: FAD-binding oxidoreductase [Caulobacteraceae bacterium]|nr:FAD-binding oxidoreductase [Caulobacteraceae bacterium]